MAVKRQRKTASSGKRSKSDLLDLAWSKNDEDVWSSSSEDERDNVDDEVSSQEEEETVEAKRIRMARAYLDKLQEKQDSEDSGDDDGIAGDDDEDVIAMELQRQRLLKQGTPIERNLAEDVRQHILKVTATTRSHESPEAQAKEWVANGTVQLWRGHDLTPTCVAMPFRQNATQCVSGSKDHSVYLWDIGREGHTKMCLVKKWNEDADVDRKGGQVTCIAMRNQYVAVGREDATVCVYDTRLAGKTNCKVTSFAGHKGPLTSLVFGDDLQLFSASTDRCIRHYNLQEMAYIETLYGHQSGVVDMDTCFGSSHPISVGRDRTARLWKLQEDAHLIFRGGGQLHAAERISYISKNWFITGHEGNATLALWNARKKKTICTATHTHGNESNQYRGVSALASCPSSDLAISGSNDGFMRCWKVTTESQEEKIVPNIEPIGQIPIHGYCNDIAISSDAKFCVAAVGQEPRLGRWDRVPRAKNRICFIALQSDGSSHSSNDGNASTSTDSESESE